MGDISIPDTALTIDTLLALDNLLEQNWSSTRDQRDASGMFEAANMGVVLMCGFSSGLRGKEMGHIRLRKSILLTMQGLQHPRSKHVVLALEGRFKGQGMRKKHKIPLVLTTASGIPNFNWLMRLFNRYETHVVSFGPLIRTTPVQTTPAQMKHLDVWFHKYLLQLQVMHPALIPEQVDVINKYSVWRSLRGGSTLQAHNKKVPKEVIELNNCWRMEESAGNKAAQGSGMLEVYTDVMAALEKPCCNTQPCCNHHGKVDNPVIAALIVT
ncbi:hypothetical protein ACA910_006166 [Epithemia clementina (nom. ined.)]